MGRRTVVWSIVVVLAVAVLASVWVFMRPATRFVIGVVAAGPGEAVLLTRRNEDHRTRFWVEHVDVDTPLRWSAELTPVGPDDALGFSSVALADTRVVILGRGPDGDVALALDRATGARVWTTTLPAAATTDTWIGPTVLIDGPRAVLVRELSGGGSAARVDVVAVADGAHLWTYELGGPGDVQVLAPDRLLVTTRGVGAVVLDGATGQVVRRLDLSWVLCPLSTGLLASQRGQVVLLSGELPRVFAADPGWRVGDGPCGEHQGDLVIGARRPDESAVVLRLDPATALPRWQAELGPRRLDPMMSVDGLLPRFLPVTMVGGDLGSEVVRELAVVDLESGAVVRRTTHEDHASVVVSAGRAWVVLPFRGTIVGLDPATGAFAGATAFTGLRSVDLRREDLQFGALWMYGTAWARPDALPWVSLDLTGGGVLRTNGEVVARDVSAEVRALFGE